MTRYRPMTSSTPERWFLRRGLVSMLRGTPLESHASVRGAPALVETVGSMDPLAPGDSDYLVVDLQPGRYIATCFLPKGATSMDTMQSAEGEPHAALGMVQEFTVA